jgi:hypothetical protein
MSQVLGTSGLLDFVVLRPVLAWRAFWNLWTVYFFNFQFFFSGRGKPRILNQWILNQRMWGHDCNCLSLLSRFATAQRYSHYVRKSHISLAPPWTIQAFSGQRMCYRHFPFLCFCARRPRHSGSIPGKGSWSVYSSRRPDRLYGLMAVTCVVWWQ